MCHRQRPTPPHTLYYPSVLYVNSVMLTDGDGDSLIKITGASEGGNASYFSTKPSCVERTPKHVVTETHSLMPH